MGNSRWRLQTSLNYVAKHARDLGREAEVEVLVADWGSEVPLHEVVELGPAAARITSFISIPRAVTSELQQDSPFAEVLALNAAARRSRGTYIGRIDQDTLVGKRFLQTFFDLHEGRRHLDVPMESALLFANLRMVPYRFAVRSPNLPTVDRFVRWFGSRLSPENARSSGAFHEAAVGIWMAHRDIWNECGGYDERMIYMNAMETNMIRRLLSKHEVVDLGRIVGPDFFHLEHYHPWGVRKSSAHRKVNPHLPFSEPDTLNPNGEVWGLVACDFPIEASSRMIPHGTMSGEGLRAKAASMCLIAGAWLQVRCDSAGIVMRNTWKKWTRRGRLVRSELLGAPLTTWPRILRGMLERRTATR